MKMENIIIEHTKNNYWIVKADTERFGKNEVLFEGINFNECLNYIWKNNGCCNYTAEVLDCFNTEKIWIIKHSKCGHYTFNQKVAGRLYGKSFQRSRKFHVMDIINAIVEHEQMLITMN